MESVFLKILNMSITASWLVVAVVLLRLAFKKAPKIVSLILWALVGIRLVLPFSLESVFSLVPNTQTFTPDFSTFPAPTIPNGTQIQTPGTSPLIPQTPDTSMGTSLLDTLLSVANIVWVAGVAAMLLYALVSYIRLRLRVREAVKSEGNVMVCDNIASPFILGIIRPKIYIPSSTDVKDIYYVLAHENAHLKRRDHFWKPLGFFLLSVYWFNPVMWVAYVLLCRDIELACDEKVIKTLGIEAKKPYSTALVNCSVSRKAIAICPLAFGEVGVKKRVKTVLNYKKPAFWIIVVALILCIVVAICFLTIRPTDNNDSTTTTTTNQNTTTTTAPDNNSTTTTTNNSTTTTTDNGSTDTVPVESMKILNKVHYYNIDGERGQEFCMIIPVEDAPHELFRIIVVGGDEKIPKYYAIYNCNDMHSHQFAQTDDGRVGIIAISNDNDRSPADSRPFWDTFMDISVENGRIVLREDGKVIEPYDLGPEPLYGNTVNLSNFYFDSKNSMSHQLRGDYRTSEETIALGYMKYAASESEAPKTYWVLAVIDYDNPELTTYISLGAHEDIDLITERNGRKYENLPEGIYIDDDYADQLYGRVLYQDGGYTLVHEIG